MSKPLTRPSDQGNIGGLLARVAALEGQLAKLSETYSDVAARIEAQGDSLGLVRMMGGPTDPGLKAATFDSRYSTAIAMTNNRMVWSALYWPGGVMNGFAWIQTTTGAYTDSGSAYWLYTSDLTNLTPVADAGAISAAGLWKDAQGLRTRSFGGAFPQDMDEGVYYMGTIYRSSAETTAPQIAGLVVPDASVFTGIGSQVSGFTYPTNAQPVYDNPANGALTGPPPATVSINSVEDTTRQNYPWLGLW